MDNKLFRKSAAERVSSPEQLNEYMKVAGPGVWVIMGGLIITFAAFIVWGLMGTIPETVHFDGTVLRGADGRPAVHSYLPIDESRQLEVGMTVRISPTFAPIEQYGYIHGTIAFISPAPVSAEFLTEALGDYFAMLTLPAGNVIEVIIEIELENGRPRWSTPRGAEIDVPIGSYSELTVITRERRPVELMFR